MQDIRGKCVVLGVSGGIAAYKAVEIASRLKKLGAEVMVIMTENATRFVTPLTFRSITGRPVCVGMFDDPQSYDIEHISLAEKADIVVIAPATANIIGKIANGIADDMLSTTIMASKAVKLFCPAMNHNMFENPIVQENIDKLKKLGYSFMEPDDGLMACGTTGRGRLPEPAEIINCVFAILCDNVIQTTMHQDLQGKKVLITAGPTREMLDPVRFISNRSSGKMGYAFANAAKKRGAQVTVVSGPVSVTAQEGIDVVSITTAQQMRDRVMELYSQYDIIVLVAAVADYRPINYSDNKLKKSDDNITISLIKNPDIAKELGVVKGSRIVIGTCAETEDIVENASKKLKAKNFDLIMANDVTMQGAGFEVDTNIVKILTRDNSVIELPQLSKLEVANKVFDEAIKLGYYDSFREKKR